MNYAERALMEVFWSDDDSDSDGEEICEIMSTDSEEKLRSKLQHYEEQKKRFRLVRIKQCLHIPDITPSEDHVSFFERPDIQVQVSDLAILDQCIEESKKQLERIQKLPVGTTPHEVDTSQKPPVGTTPYAVDAKHMAVLEDMYKKKLKPVLLDRHVELAAKKRVAETLTFLKKLLGEVGYIAKEE